jgi:hypothetical protein
MLEESGRAESREQQRLRSFVKFFGTRWRAHRRAPRSLTLRPFVSAYETYDFAFVETWIYYQPSRLSNRCPPILRLKSTPTGGATSVVGCTNMSSHLIVIIVWSGLTTTIRKSSSALSRTAANRWLTRCTSDCRRVCGEKATSAGSKSFGCYRVGAGSRP